MAEEEASYVGKGELWGRRGPVAILFFKAGVGYLQNTKSSGSTHILNTAWNREGRGDK